MKNTVIIVLLLVCPACLVGAQDLSLVFYSDRTGNAEIFIQDLTGGEARNLTNNPAKDNCPAVSPDGRQIAFLSERNGTANLYLMQTDGSGLHALTRSEVPIEHPSWAPSGDLLYFVKDYGNRTEIWSVLPDGSGPVLITANEWRDERPFLSVNGRIVFMSNRDGNYDIYTMAPDGTDLLRLTATPSLEIFPVWSPDGKQIAYSQKIRQDGMLLGGIRLIAADGSDDRAVTDSRTRDEDAAWSPSGRYIAFQSVRDGNFEIYVVDMETGVQQRITDNPAWDGWPCFVPSVGKD